MANYFMRQKYVLSTLLSIVASILRLVMEKLGILLVQFYNDKDSTNTSVCAGDRAELDSTFHRSFTVSGSHA